MMVQRQECWWVCIFREIQSKSWCTSRICAVTTLFANICGRYYRKSKRDVVNESLYADEVVLMNKAMEYLKERF